MIGEEIVCSSCGVKFTRNSRAARSSDFYNTRAQNDTCIVCREGLDPDTLEPLATKGRTMDGLTLLNAIEAALVEVFPRVHPTIRKEAAVAVRRNVLRAGLTCDPLWPAPAPTCDCDPVDVGAAGRRVLDAAARGDRDYGAPPTLAGEPGEILGKARNVVVHPDGRLTFDMEVNDAGAKFIGQIRRAEPTGPLPPIERPPAPGSMSCEHGRRRYTSNGPARCSGGFTEAKCRCYPTARTPIRTWARGVLDKIKGANRGE